MITLPINCEYLAEDGSCNHWTAPPVYRFGVLIRPGKCILQTADTRVACCERRPVHDPKPPTPIESRRKYRDAA